MVKRLSELLKGITSKQDGDFYCLNCLHLFRTKSKLESDNKPCQSKDTKTFELNQHQKSDKAPSIIYVDLEFLIKRIDGCKNNFEKSSTTKVLNIFLVDIQCLRYGRLMI